MVTIIGEEAPPFFLDLHKNWESLLENIDGLPQFFGLIGLQCYAAHRMESDNHYTAADYKSRLSEVLGVAKEQLQTLFAAADRFEQPVQERIWEAMRVFVDEEFGQQLDLPKPTTYAHRYTQFPKSQSLLNTEDLRHFTLFFYQTFEENEEVAYTYFKERLTQTINITKTRHSVRVMEDPDKTERCYRQIYQFFNTWDGEVFDPEQQKVIRKANSLQGDFHRQLFLRFEEGEPIFLAGDKMQILQAISANDFFARAQRIRRQRGLLFLTLDEYYPEEYEAARYFFGDQACYVLLDKQQSSVEKQFLENRSNTKIDVSERLRLYRYDPTSAHPPIFFKKYMRPYRHIFFSGGIRVNRSREYLAGFGPMINSDSAFRVLYKNRKVAYAPATAELGMYVIRRDEKKDQFFQIVGSLPLQQPVPEISFGWNLSIYQPSIHPDIEGCVYRVTVPMTQPINVSREWITILTEGRRQKRTSVNHSLLRMLNNAHL